MLLQLEMSVVMHFITNVSGYIIKCKHMIIYIQNILKCLAVVEVLSFQTLYANYRTHDEKNSKFLPFVMLPKGWY